MLLLTREILVRRLLELPKLTDRYAGRDASFVPLALAWLSDSEQDLLRLRHPQASLLAAERMSILAATDGPRSSGARAGNSPRRAQQVACVGALGRIDATLREVVTQIDGQLATMREKMAQLVAVASTAKPIPLPSDTPRDTWLRVVWAGLLVNGETAGMHRYLSAALTPPDRLHLLQEILENLLELAPPATH